MSRLFPSPAWSPQRPTGARAAPSQPPLEAQEADRLFRVHSTDFGRAAVGRGCCGGRGRGLACHTGHLCHDHAPPVQSPGGAPCCRPPGVATAVALAVGAGRWPLAAGQRRPRPQPGASLRSESSRDSADSGWGFPGPSGSLVQTERPEMDRALHTLPPAPRPADGTGASRGSVYSAGGSRSSWCGRPVAERLLRVRGVCGSSHASSVPPVPPAPPAAVPALVPVGSFSPPCEDSRAGKPYGHICDHWAQAWEPRLTHWALGFPSDPPQGPTAGPETRGSEGWGAMV